MTVFSLLLLAAATPAEPVKCEAKPFTLAKPAVTAKGAAGKAAPAKAEPPKPMLKPSCNHPGHGQPGHKH